jgi:hypothetical protein
VLVQHRVSTTPFPRLPACWRSRSSGRSLWGTFGFALDPCLTELHVASDIQLALKAEVSKLAEAQVPSQVQGEQRLVLKRALEESVARSFRLAPQLRAARRPRDARSTAH